MGIIIIRHSVSAYILKATFRNKYTYIPFCDPGINDRHPLLSVQSSSAIQTPINLRGSV